MVRTKQKLSQRFRGPLEHDGTTLQWTVMRVPFEPADVWPNRKRMRVRGSINGFPFRTSLFRGRDGCCLLLVNKAMQKGAAATRGSVADVELEPDTEERVVTTPPELEKLLRQDKSLHAWHAQLNASSRKWLADWVAQPKSAEARRTRAERTAERLLLTMEAEQSPPPILEALFQGRPAARAAWQRMTALQRRGHLLGIFNYRTPESRQKRALKAVEDALRLAKGKED